MTKKGEEDTEFTVKNVQNRAGYVLHIGEVEGVIKKGDILNQFIDTQRRSLIMKNHTGTHVLNYALRKVLQETEQKGSLVAPDRLRFDFTAKQAMTPEQVKQTEQLSNEVIFKNETVFAKNAPLASAKSVNGLRAVFEEQYPDPVRIVSVGVPVDELLNNPEGDSATKTPVEFCGGTHLHNAGHIGHLVITSEEAIAKGIRRIIAVTGPEAERALQRKRHFESMVDDLSKKIKLESNPDKKREKEILQEIVRLDDEIGQAQISTWKKEELRASLKN
jgi:alanyl-tRNA synthetase